MSRSILNVVMIYLMMVDLMRLGVGMLLMVMVMIWVRLNEL